MNSPASDPFPAPGTPPASPIAAAWWARLLRSLVLVVLGLALALLFGLMLVGHISLARDAVEPLFSYNSAVNRTAILLTVAVTLLVPIGILVGAERKGLLTWPVLALTAVVLTPIFAWLAWDEPALRQPATIEEFSPAFPGAEQSYALVMRYSKRSTSAEAKAFASAKLLIPWTGMSPKEPEKWREWLTKNRAALETDWATLAPQRAWLAELAKFERIGDLTASDLNADIVAFQVWRTLSQRATVAAALLALDGRGDDAMGTLLPFLQVARGLQPSSRTLVRTMIGIVIERLILESAGYVLDTAPVSPAMRAQWQAALAAENAAPLARRLILIEYVQFAPVYMRLRLGDQLAAAQALGQARVLRRPLNLVSALISNPIATMNLYGNHVYRLANLAEKRALGEFSAQSKSFDHAVRHEPGIKNIGGRLWLNMSVPAYEKVLDTHWKTADMRDALRQRLRQPGPLAAKP